MCSPYRHLLRTTAITALSSSASCRGAGTGSPGRDPMASDAAAVPAFPSRRHCLAPDACRGSSEDPGCQPCGVGRARPFASLLRNVGGAGWPPLLSGFLRAPACEPVDTGAVCEQSVCMQRGTATCIPRDIRLHRPQGRQRRDTQPGGRPINAGRLEVHSIPRVFPEPPLCVWRCAGAKAETEKTRAAPATEVAVRARGGAGTPRGPRAHPAATRLGPPRAPGGGHTLLPSATSRLGLRSLFIHPPTLIEHLLGAGRGARHHGPVPSPSGEAAGRMSSSDRPGWPPRPLWRGPGPAAPPAPRRAPRCSTRIVAGAVACRPCTRAFLWSARGAVLSML